MRLLLLALIICFYVERQKSCFVIKGNCPNKNVTFWLYSYKTRYEPKLIDPMRPNPVDFSPIQPIKILIHGYSGYRDYSPNSFIRPILLKNDRVYVISIDYGPLAREPCYFQAVQNLPVVSKCLAQLINNLVNNGIISSDQMHIIGFSLGSQVAGQTANYLSQKLKRITGLDPAKPLFVLAHDTKRLDPSDAEFIDVIHTNPLERGTLHTMGHVDFYINFGLLQQPGCENTTTPSSCSHNRAPQLYAESINSTLGFWSNKCTSWLIYIFGQCQHISNTALMGYHVSTFINGSYFLKTSRKSPFALGKRGLEFKHSFSILGQLN